MHPRGYSVWRRRPEVAGARAWLRTSRFFRHVVWASPVWHAHGAASAPQGSCGMRMAPPLRPKPHVVCAWRRLCAPRLVLAFLIPCRAPQVRIPRDEVDEAEAIVRDCLAEVFEAGSLGTVRGHPGASAGTVPGGLCRCRIGAGLGSSVSQLAGLGVPDAHHRLLRHRFGPHLMLTLP
jgi:hypothetical protein